MFLICLPVWQGPHPNASGALNDLSCPQCAKNCIFYPQPTIPQTFTKHTINVLNSEMLEILVLSKLNRLTVLWKYEAEG